MAGVGRFRRFGRHGSIDGLKARACGPGLMKNNLLEM
jgi:hypothetical protein